MGSVVLLSACTVAFELNLVAIVAHELSDHLDILSAVVGLYLFFMGVGAWISRRVERDPARALVGCCLGAAVSGVLSTPLLFAAIHGTRVAAAGIVLVSAAVAAPCGAALPLAVRAIAARASLASSLSQSLGLDYAGALAGSLALSLWLLPAGGTAGAGVALGAVACVAGLLACPAIEAPRRCALGRLGAAGAACAALIGLVGTYGAQAMESVRAAAVGETTVHHERTPYQEIRVGRAATERLYLSGQLQYDSKSEYIYHELLVHPALSLHPHPRRVLVLGGGDGLALREIWKYPEVTRVTLVDIDPAMTRFGRSYPGVVRLSGSSFQDPRLKVVHQDAWVFVDRHAREASPSRAYDVVVIDLPMAMNVSISRLYTIRFYRLLKRVMGRRGILVVQSGSLTDRERRYVYCVYETVRAAGLHTRLYHGESLTFTLAATDPLFTGSPEVRLRVATRYLNDSWARAIFQIPRDWAPEDVEPNDLETHILLRYVAR